MWLDFDSNAGVDDGLPILAGEYWESPNMIASRISLVSATTGSKYWYAVI